MATCFFFSLPVSTDAYENINPWVTLHRQEQALSVLQTVRLTCLKSEAHSVSQKSV